MTTSATNSAATSYVDQYVRASGDSPPQGSGCGVVWSAPALLEYLTTYRLLSEFLVQVDLTPGHLAALVGEISSSERYVEFSKLPILSDLVILRDMTGLWWTGRCDKTPHFPVETAHQVAAAMCFDQSHIIGEQINAQCAFAGEFPPGTGPMISGRSFITLVIHSRLTDFLADASAKSMVGEDDWCDFYPSDLSYHQFVLDWWTNKSNYRSL